MKTMRIFALTGFVSLVTLNSCQRDSKNLFKPKAVVVDNQPTPNAPCNPNAYVITLESKTLVNGNWEWVWSVRNPNPGNGKNGTVQDLSHWGMQFGSCFRWADVVNAAYSNNGSNWHNFTPAYKVDPSQQCLTTPVLKFDYGTSGGSKTYYKLILSANYNPGSAPGYYKSGVRTGCCTFSFTGVGCEDIPV